MSNYWMVWIPVLLMFSLPGIMLIVVIVRGLTLPRGLRRGKAAVCGRCAQEDAEITDGAPLPLRCPECGIRYAQAGLLTLGLAKRGRPGMASVIICWTVLSIGIGGFATSIVSSFATFGGGGVAAHQRFSHTITTVRTDGGAPTNADGYEIRFDGDLEYNFGSPVSAGTLSLTVRPDNGPSAAISINPADGTWSIPATGASGTAFNRNAALASLEAGGIDTSPAYVGFEADELADAVQLVRADPDTAIYGVLGGYGNTYTQPSNTLGVTTSWYPGSLAVTDQKGDSSGELRFGFESDTTDSSYSGTPSERVFDGAVAFRFADDGAGGRRVDTVELFVRPPEGWPVTLRYSLDDASGTLTQQGGAESHTPESDLAALEKVAELTGTTGASGALDPGLSDVLRLSEEARKTPTTHDQAAPAHPHASGQTGAAANAPGDGEPDGGFVSLRPATQNWVTPMGGYQSAFPIAILGPMGGCFLLYAGGVVFIVVRRFRIYPDRLVGPQGPPHPRAVGPRLPGNR